MRITATTAMMTRLSVRSGLMDVAFRLNCTTIPGSQRIPHANRQPSSRGAHRQTDRRLTCHQHDWVAPILPRLRWANARPLCSGKDCLDEHDVDTANA